MKLEDAQRYPAIPVMLKDGRAVTIRPLAADDGEVMATFYAGVPREDFRFYCPGQLTRDNALRKAEQADSPLGVVLVLELPDGSIGGYAWYCWETPDAERSVFGICISRACQGAGAGRLLMTRLLEIAREVGPPIMTLTVQLANPRAAALYQSMGFQIIREQMRGEVPDHGFEAEPEYYMEQRVR